MSKSDIVIFYAIAAAKWQMQLYSLDYELL